MYEWFDFHKECAKMQWQNISKLIETIQKKLDTFGYFSAQIESSVMLGFYLEYSLLKSDLVQYQDIRTAERNSED